MEIPEGVELVSDRHPSGRRGEVLEDSSRMSPTCSGRVFSGILSTVGSMRKIANERAYL